MTNKNNRGFWNALGEIAMDVVDGMAQAAEMSIKARKDKSESKVRYETNSTTARAYRQLIETTDVLTSREKEKLVRELASHLGVSMAGETTIIREVETPVATRTIIVSNEGWTENQVNSFDSCYMRYKDRSDVAEKIKLYGYTNKSLMEIQKRVQQYKSAGL